MGDAPGKTIAHPYDAVLTYHTNPLTCGVAKFNYQLAGRLGVPCLDLMPWPESVYPLLSLKYSELRDTDREWLCDSVSPSGGCAWFDVLWHDGGLPYVSERAHRVFYADQIGCPSTIQGDPTRGTYRVLTFGMAHKRVLHHFEALKTRLDAEHPDYTIHLSTAVHEGSPWDTSHQEAEAGMRAIFGDKLRVLGFLADDALAKELADCDAVAAYFTPALRANNTSAWAAIDAGKQLYTNTDDQSPSLDAPPTWATLLEVLRAA